MRFWAVLFLFLFLSGPVAQRLEQGTHNPLVVGSNPSGPTILLWRSFICYKEQAVGTTLARPEMLKSDSNGTTQE